MIVVDLSKEQALDADPGATQQNNFTANLGRAGGQHRNLFHFRRSKRNYFKFCTRHCKSIVNTLCNNF